MAEEVNSGPLGIIDRESAGQGPSCNRLQLGVRNVCLPKVYGIDMHSFSLEYPRSSSNRCILVRFTEQTLQWEGCLLAQEIYLLGRRLVLFGAVHCRSSQTWNHYCFLHLSRPHEYNHMPTRHRRVS